MAQGTCRECATEDRHLPGRGLCAGCYHRRWQAQDWGPYDILSKGGQPAAFDLAPYTEKACAICKVVKPLEDFAKNNRRPDGRGSYCKPCARDKYQRPAIERKQRIEQHYDGEQECRKCGETKPITEFYWSRDKGKYQSDCISCRGRGGKVRWARTGRDLQRRHQLRSKFGMTDDDYAVMLAAQGGGCAICEYVPAEGERRLAVDHDHATGRVRALLCSRCNTGVGMFLEQPRIMRLAASYVELHSALGGDERVA